MAKKKTVDDESPLWVTVLKLVIGLVVIIGGVGFALWYAQGMDTGTPAPASDAWGISHDSPLRMKR
jgi:hypothetical protein